MKKIKVENITGSGLSVGQITTLYETLEELKRCHPIDRSDKTADGYWDDYGCSDDVGVVVGVVVGVGGCYVYVNNYDQFEVVEEINNTENPKKYYIHKEVKIGDRITINGLNIIVTEEVIENNKHIFKCDSQD